MGNLSLFGATGGARFSPSGRYRYTLSRELGAGHGVVAFLMLNPSTATETENDPTIRRCIGFARAWGYRRLEVLNLFALRSTDPAGLLEVEPVGPENDAAIAEIARAADRVVCAWGTHSGGVHKLLVDRERRVLELLSGVPLSCLATAQDGRPRHPLYLRSDLKPVPWPAGEGA
jgi:hypothetical protein